MMQPLIEILGSYQSVWSVIISLVLFILFSALACKVCGRFFRIFLFETRDNGATKIRLVEKIIPGWPLFVALVLVALVVSPLRLSLIALLPDQATTIGTISLVCLLLAGAIFLLTIMWLVIASIVLIIRNC